MRILVVDDEHAVRDALRRALDLDGYEVQIAPGAPSRRSALMRERPPDAIVLDVLMPGMDGLEVCRRLRAGGDRTPVLMLTARDAVGDRVAGLDAGADDYLVKPFALEELLARLRALLRRSGAERPADGAVLELRRLCARPRRPRGAPRRARDRADADRVPAARAVPAQPAPGARARRRSSSASGATTSAPARTRSRSTSATCAARLEAAASRA